MAYPATVSALDRFVTYNVPARTITSGDFVVGFLAANPPNVFPADQDQLTASQKRSYVSTNGLNYTLLDTGGPDLAGNLAIRAVATVGTASGHTTCVTRPASIVSWWPGDGNANDLAGGLNGTVQGGVSYSAGEVGQAFNLDGTGYIQIGNPANLRLCDEVRVPEVGQTLIDIAGEFLVPLIQKEMIADAENPAGIHRLLLADGRQLPADFLRKLMRATAITGAASIHFA